MQKLTKKICILWKFINNEILEKHFLKIMYIFVKIFKKKFVHKNIHSLEKLLLKNFLIFRFQAYFLGKFLYFSLLEIEFYSLHIRNFGNRKLLIILRISVKIYPKTLKNYNFGYILLKFGR